MLSWRRSSAFARIWSHVLDVTVGYGYRPWQAALWLVTAVAVATMAFETSFEINRDGKPDWKSYDINPARDVSQVPSFDSLLYSVDLLIPVISLGHRAAWNTNGDAAQAAAFVLTITGWLLTTTLIAGLAARRQ